MQKIERKISNGLKLLTKSYPALLITGPRQAGKTTLCRELFSDLAYINLEDLEMRDFALSDP